MICAGIAVTLKGGVHAGHRRNVARKSYSFGMNHCTYSRMAELQEDS
jgi:hypothetical protein